jgi:hypothetical protein
MAPNLEGSGTTCAHAPSSKSGVFCLPPPSEQTGDHPVRQTQLLFFRTFRYYTLGMAARVRAAFLPSGVKTLTNPGGVARMMTQLHGPGVMDMPTPPYRHVLRGPDGKAEFALARFDGGSRIEASNAVCGIGHLHGLRATVRARAGIVLVFRNACGMFRGIQPLHQTQP